MKLYQLWTENDSGRPLEHEYDIIDKEDSEVILQYSNDKTWREPCGKVASMINTGDNLKIKLNGMKELTLDYMQAHQLLILLAFDSREWKNEIREIKTIKQF